MGLYFVCGRFVYKARRKRRTLYAVTDRRVMSVVRERRGEAVETIYLSAIPNISSTESGGRGNVEFGSPSPLDGLYANTGAEVFGRRSGSPGVGFGFYDIEDPHAVAELVERLRARAAPRLDPG